MIWGPVPSLSRPDRLSFVQRPPPLQGSFNPSGVLDSGQTCRWRAQGDQDTHPAGWQKGNYRGPRSLIVDSRNRRLHRHLITLNPPADIGCGGPNPYRNDIVICTHHLLSPSSTFNSTFILIVHQPAWRGPYTSTTYVLLSIRDAQRLATARPHPDLQFKSPLSLSLGNGYLKGRPQKTSSRAFLRVRFTARPFCF